MKGSEDESSIFGYDKEEEAKDEAELSMFEAQEIWRFSGGGEI